MTIRAIWEGMKSAVRSCCSCFHGRKMENSDESQPLLQIQRSLTRDRNLRNRDAESFSQLPERQPPQPEPHLPSDSASPASLPSESPPVPLLLSPSGAALLTNITASRPYATTIGGPPGVGKTMAAWQALAGEITNLVISPTTGVPDTTKAGELLAVFSKIDQYCDNQLYGDKSIAVPNPLAQHLLTPGGALPGIELFAKQATQVLGAIANKTDDILTNGFFTKNPSIDDSPIGTAGQGTAIIISGATPSTLLQNTTGSSTLDVANLNSAILKTLLTPHRQAGLDSCAIDSTIISETINNPTRMAGMYKSLLETGTVKTPAGEDVVLKQFTPFLTTGTFAGNTNPFPMTNLDSMLVHSLACMLYEDKDVSAQSLAYGLAEGMPGKYLGEPPNGAFNVNATTGTISAIDVKELLLHGKIDPTGKTSQQAVSDSALGRPYVPSHFKLGKFNHGQDFIVVAASPNSLVIDTNWIDPNTGCPIYWRVDTTTTQCEPSIVSDMVFKPCPSDGGRAFLPLSMHLPSGQIYLMPKVL